jgi:hypothetical protein
VFRKFLTSYRLPRDNGYTRPYDPRKYKRATGYLASGRLRAVDDVLLAAASKHGGGRRYSPPF